MPKLSLSLEYKGFFNIRKIKQFNVDVNNLTEGRKT